MREKLAPKEREENGQCGCYHRNEISEGKHCSVAGKAKGSDTSIQYGHLLES